MPGNFFDTNVLIYLASSDRTKADQAENVLARGGAISVQVLNEVANVTRRKMRMTWHETHEFLTLIRGLSTVHPIGLDTHETGLMLAERYSLSIYDAMIVAAALHANCDTLWSEDMQDGLVIEGCLRIANPFRGQTP
jgi:predicted nucleic acid-binding protein